MLSEPLGDPIRKYADKGVCAVRAVCRRIGKNGSLYQKLIFMPFFVVETLYPMEFEGDPFSGGVCQHDKHTFYRMRSAVIAESILHASLG